MVFRPDVELVADRDGFTGRNGYGGSGIANNIVTGPGLPGSKSIRIVGVGYPCADKIMLQHCHPAAGQVSPKGVLGHVIEIEFGKPLIGLGQRRS